MCLKPTPLCLPILSPKIPLPFARAPKRDVFPLSLFSQVLYTFINSWVSKSGCLSFNLHPPWIFILDRFGLNHRLINEHCFGDIKEQSLRKPLKVWIKARDLLVFSPFCSRIAYSSVFLLFVFISFSPTSVSKWFSLISVCFSKRIKCVLTADSSVFMALMWLAKHFINLNLIQNQKAQRKKKRKWIKVK